MARTKAAIPAPWVCTRRRLRRTAFACAGVLLCGVGVGLGMTVVMLPVGAAFVVVGVATLAAGIRDETERMA